jgi:hypothetical protein
VPPGTDVVSQIGYVRFVAMVLKKSFWLNSENFYDR